MQASGVTIMRQVRVVLRALLALRRRSPAPLAAMASLNFCPCCDQSVADMKTEQFVVYWSPREWQAFQGSTQPPPHGKPLYDFGKCVRVSWGAGVFVRFGLASVEF